MLFSSRSLSSTQMAEQSIKHQVCLKYMTSSQFYFTFILVFVDHCVDSYELCKRIPKEHCQHISFLKTVCPLTCGECEGWWSLIDYLNKSAMISNIILFLDPCSINNGGCNQFCSGVTEAQCSCRDGYQLATDRKTCIGKKLDVLNNILYVLNPLWRHKSNNYLII